MTNLNEEQRVKQIIKHYKNKYPRAVATKQDKNLIGGFLETLTRQAFSNNGLKVVDWAVGKGDRGIDAKVIVDSFNAPLLLAIECMNGRFDYTPKYFDALKNRLKQASKSNWFPIIICVDKKANFSRFTGNFSCNVEFIELGKQFHPNKTSYSDYEVLKEKVLKTFNKIAWAERPEEMQEWQQKLQELQEIEEENQVLDKLDEEKLSEKDNELQPSGLEKNKNQVKWEN